MTLDHGAKNALLRVVWAELPVNHYILCPFHESAVVPEWLKCSKRLIALAFFMLITDRLKTRDRLTKTQHIGVGARVQYKL
ncbi:MAG: hypothetical protein CL537_06210 [Alcanivoracaceae bacterium]|uniref:hypothetical protein n=1 Tax=Alcanivorax sp. MD8A TaxID=1177157 RepID=UPI000C43AE69|nr:hypothetical protein [Alcanivorax sp. MD8A]MAX55092.1 hypothetical protein [Alcanivoracaceae bacterium]|tara:strand:+ start:3515 stop:3757 length:243 start_codon:yes stop_codon:yes gene_type:complete